jgi:hypothetical protein
LQTNLRTIAELEPNVQKLLRKRPMEGDRSQNWRLSCGSYEEATEDRESSALIERPPALDRTSAAINRTWGLMLFFLAFTYYSDFSFLVLVVLGF